MKLAYFVRWVDFYHLFFNILFVILCIWYLQYVLLVYNFSSFCVLLELTKWNWNVLYRRRLESPGNLSLVVFIYSLIDPTLKGWVAVVFVQNYLILTGEQWGSSVPWRLLGIRLYTRRENGEDETSLWSSKRNYYNYSDVLQKYESNGSIPCWWRRLYRHWGKNIASRYVRTIYVFNLSRFEVLWRSINLIKENAFT